MKKQYVSLLIIILSVSCLLFSCHNNMNKKVGELIFDSIQVNQTSHLFNDTAKPACNLTINFTYPTQSADKVLKDSLESYFITACFGEKYLTDNPKEVIKSFTQNYVDNYRHDLEPMYLEDEKERGKDKDNAASISAWYSYYKAIESHVQFYKNALLVYRIDYNEYTGGAHGIYTSTFLNIDLNKKSPIKIDQLFIADYKEALTDLIWNQLMAENKVTTHEALEDLGYGSTGDITPTDNFYLSSDGITFYYNVYDITPYAMGPVKVSIPFSMMAHLLSNHPIIKDLTK